MTDTAEFFSVDNGYNADIGTVDNVSMIEGNNFSYMVSNDSGVEVGRLTFSGSCVSFEGSFDTSSQVFFSFLKLLSLIDPYIACMLNGKAAPVKTKEELSIDNLQRFLEF